MAIDPARLARIRTRLLAAAVLAVPACGGGSAQTINHSQPEPPSKQHDGPINEVVADPPPATPNPDSTAKPNEDIHINTPPPQAHLGEGPDGRDINRPKPDATTRVLSPKDAPPPIQTINTPPTPATVQHVNTPPPAPKKPKENVNTPEPMRRPDNINTPKPD